MSISLTGTTAVVVKGLLIIFRGEYVGLVLLLVGYLLVVEIRFVIVVDLFRNLIGYRFVGNVVNSVSCSSVVTQSSTVDSHEVSISDVKSISVVDSSVVSLSVEAIIKNIFYYRTKNSKNRR